MQKKAWKTSENFIEWKYSNISNTVQNIKFFEDQDEKAGKMSQNSRNLFSEQVHHLTKKLLRIRIYSHNVEIPNLTVHEHSVVIEEI